MTKSFSRRCHKPMVISVKSQFSGLPIVPFCHCEAASAAVAISILRVSKPPFSAVFAFGPGDCHAPLGLAMTR